MTYFNVFDWSDSIYWNAKNQAIVQGGTATKNTARFRRYIEGAYTESIAFDVNNDDEIGIGYSSAKRVISGVDYKAWCDINGKSPRLPETKPLVMVKNTRWWIVKYMWYKENSQDGTWDSKGKYWCWHIAPTVEARAVMDNNEIVDQPILTYSNWVDESLVVKYENTGSTNYPYTYYEIRIQSFHTMPSDTATDLLNTVDFFNDGAQYNVLPSIELKDFLTKYQLDEGSPLGLRPIEWYDSGVNTQKNYSTDEAETVLLAVRNFVNDLDECVLAWGLGGRIKYYINCEEGKRCGPTYDNSVISTTLYTNGTKSYAGTSFADTIAPTGTLQIRHRKYTDYIVTSTSQVGTYNDITVTEGSLGLPMEYGEVERIPTELKSSADIKQTIEDNGYTEADDIELQYRIMTVLRQVYMALDILPDEHSVTLFFSKQTLLDVLDNLLLTAYKLDDEYDSHVSNVVKESDTGRLLKDAGYLDSIMNTSDVARLDHMFLSFRVNLQDGVNRFSDGDISNSADEVTDLLSRKGIWEYLNVCVYEASDWQWIDGTLTEVKWSVPVAYLPNWSKLQKGNNSTTAAILSAMMKIDNHIKPYKPSTWVKIREAVVTAVIVVIILIVSCTNPATCPSGVSLALTTIALLSNIAAAATGSDTWQKVSMAASIANLATAVTNPNMTIGQFISGQGLQIGFMLANMYVAHEHTNKMEAIQKRINSTNEEKHEIQELETIVEARYKVKEYITTEHHTDRYSLEYDRLYNIKYI